MSKGQWRCPKARSRLNKRRRKVQYLIARLIREGRLGEAAVVVDRRQQR